VEGEAADAEVEVFENVPYFPVDNARVICTSKVQNS
jgi:hypothetical protein